MPKLLLLLFLLCSSIGFAQPDGWEVTNLNKAAHIVICKQKKKVGIWSKARGDFLTPPHEGEILHFSDAQILLEINTKEDTVYVFHYYQGSVQQLTSPNEKGNFSFASINSDEWNQKLKFEPKTKENSGDTLKGSIVKVEEGKDYGGQDNHLSYEFDGQYLIVQFYHYDFGSDPFAEPLQDSHGMDSINNNGEAVYPPAKPSYIKKSGVYDLKNKSWSVPPKYEAIKKWEHLYAGYFWPNEDDLQTETEYDIYNGLVYDFYAYEKKFGILPTSYLNQQSYAFPLELWPYEAETVWYDRDSSFIYAQTKKGIGLHFVPMSGKSVDADGFYTRAWMDSDGHMDHIELMPAIYDDIILLGNMDLVTAPTGNKMFYALGSKGDNMFDILLMNDMLDEALELGRDTLIEDVEVQSYIQIMEANLSISDSTVMEETEPILIVDGNDGYRFCPMNKKFSDDKFYYKGSDYCSFANGDAGYRFRIDLIDDDRFMVTEYVLEDPSDWTPVYDELYDYVYDENGNQLYYPGDPGIYRSGLYDPIGHKWLIPAENIRLYRSAGGYLIEKPILRDGSIYDGRTISFVNDDLKYEFKNKKYSDLVGPDFMKYQIDGFNASGTHHVSPQNEFTVYFKTEDGFGVGSIVDLSSQILLEPVEAPCYLQNDMIVFVDEDSLQLKIFNAIDHGRGPLSVGLEWEVGTTYMIKGNINSPKSDKYGRRSIQSKNDFTFHVQTDSTEQIFKIERVPVPNGYSFDSLKLKKTEPKYSTARTDFSELALPTDSKAEIAWIEIWSDSLVYIRNNQGDEEELVPMRSLWDPIMDSIDLAGNVVYYPKRPGFCGSGVYNRYTKEWVVEPAHIGVEWISGNIFLIHHGLRDRDDLLDGSEFIIMKGDKRETISKGPSDYSFVRGNCGRISDSLIFINEHANVDQFIALKSQTDYGFGTEDSIDNNGEVVYEEQPPYVHKSGVLNVYTNEWVIPQEFHAVIVLDDIFVVVQKELDKAGYPVRADWPLGQKYAIYDLNGNLIQDFVPMDEILQQYRDKVRNALG